MTTSVNDVRSQFCEWLQENAPKLRADVACQALAIGEDFCTRIKVLKAPLFETTDIDTVRKFVKTVTANKIFRIRNKKQYQVIVDSANRYLAFVRVLTERRSSAMQKEYKQEVVLVESEPALEPVRVGDNLLGYFDSVKSKYPDLIFTNLNAKDEVVNRAVYILPVGVNRRGNVLFEIWHLANEGCFDLYIKRSLLTNEEYQESLGSWEKTTETRGKITRKFACRNELIEFLLPKLDLARETVNNEVVPSASSRTIETTTDELEGGFVNWLRNKGMAEATVRSYASSINSAETFARESGIAGISLSSNDCGLVLRSIDILLENHDFIEHNKRQHNRFSAAFRKLRDYIAEIQRRDTQRTSDTELEVKCPELYHKLYSVSKIYDNPDGLTVDHIISMIGNGISKAEIIEFLERISWATKLSEERYSFAQHVIQNATLVGGESPEPIVTIPNDFDKDAFVRVLMTRYRNGMQFDSIDFEIFRDTYADFNDASLNFTDEELEERLKYCGVYYMDRLFPAEGIIDSSTSERLFAYIETQFASGSKVLYYKAIFSDLADAFAYCFSLTDERMLRAYIEFMADKGKYYFFENYMSTEKNVTIDHSAEIVEFMLSAGKPLSYDDVYEGLSHISKDIIYREIRSGSNYVMNGKENYFHIKIFEFSESDGETIAEILDREIEENGYAIWSNVFAIVQEQMAVFLENNLYLSPLGIRNALSKVMSNRFDFDGEVISAYGAKLAMADVFRLYAKHNAPFTDIDLYNFSKETDTTIYFGAVAEATVRVSKTLFVSKNHVEFDIEAVDKALSTYLTSGYILVKDVDSFLVFPNVGYEWNEYLLESFLLYYSKKFTLVNNGTSLNNVAGAVALKGGEYSEFVDICAHALANSGVELKKTIALDYLAEINLITRRSYREIEIAIAKARQLRNRKG